MASTSAAITSRRMMSSGKRCERSEASMKQNAISWIGASFSAVFNRICKQKHGIGTSGS